MLTNYIFIGIIAASLVTLVVLIVRKFPDLSAMNVASLSEAKASEVRNRIMLQRLISKLSNMRRSIRRLIVPLKQLFDNYVISVQKKLKEMERQTQEEDKPLKMIEAKQEAKELLKKATEHIEAEEYDQAEEVLIEIIELDSKNLDAYEHLVEVYRFNRDYKKARETARYYLKLVAQKDAKSDKHRVASAHAELGEIYELEQKPEQALKSYEKALDLEPSNPRMLDLLLKISILLERKELAWKTFNQLKEANPDNQKLSELRAEIEALPEATE